MKLGVLMDMRNSPRNRWFIPWPELYGGAIEFVEELERMGFDAVSMAEHHGDPTGYNPAPLLTLASFAARTKVIRLGTNISQIPHHHPILFAEHVAVLDNLCGGRVDLGLGQVGEPFNMEFEMLGNMPPSRGTRFDEGLAVAMKCWTEDEPFDFKGKHWDLKRVWINPKPLQKPYPPTWLVGFRPGPSMDRAARLGLDVGGPGGGFIAATAGEYWNPWLELWHDACRRHGRDPHKTRTNIFGTCFITDDPEKAWAKHREGVFEHFMYERNGVRPYAAMLMGADFNPQTPEDLPGWQKVFRTADDAIAEFRSVFATAAPTEMHLIGRRFGMTYEETAAYLRNFMEQVAPALRDLV
jgi:alkanesulfonate monooxygenase SsuD/methylene tetrahydromethanopterin reductase-like flavin-dependent oxidoreductase (luciferase family)